MKHALSKTGGSCAELAGLFNDGVIGKDDTVVVPNRVEEALCALAIHAHQQLDGVKRWPEITLEAGMK